MKSDMKTENRVIVTVAPERMAMEKFRTTLLYQQLIEEGAPIKWKDGKPPADRDATEKDLRFPTGRIRINGNTAEALWV